MAGRIWGVSYRQRDVDQIYKYIQNQEEHHRKQSFREEYLDLLKEFEVIYDEQYIFQGLIGKCEFFKMLPTILYYQANRTGNGVRIVFSIRYCYKRSRW